MNLHYKTDEAVKEDLELQTWCREITEIGLLGAQDQGKLSPLTETSNLRDSSLEFPQNPLYFYGNFQKDVPNMIMPKCLPRFLFLAAKDRSPSYSPRTLLGPRCNGSSGCS